MNRSCVQRLVRVPFLNLLLQLDILLSLAEQFYLSVFYYDYVKIIDRPIQKGRITNNQCVPGKSLWCSGSMLPMLPTFFNSAPD